MSEVEEVLSQMDEQAAKFMRMAMSNEPLHDDLDPYLGAIDGTNMMALRHPLVYSVPYTGAGLPNHTYKIKREAEAEFLKNAQYVKVVWLYERPYRFWKFSEFADLFTDEEYWELLGSIWTDSENIHESKFWWHAALSSDRPGRELLMSEDEREAYDALPDTITIYRGCKIGLNEDGLSWTTDLARARWFANRFGGDDEYRGAVRTATVKKEDVVALFNGRGECEVVINDFHSVTEINLELT